MSKVVKRRWRNEVASGLPRRDRASCDYGAYIPDPLVGRAVRLDGEVAADVADAETAITRFDAGATALADTEALARLLLRAESVASSKIEGLEVGGRRLLRAEAAQALGDEAGDVTALEVLGNIQAMAWALNTVGRGSDITLDSLLEVHRRLLAGTPLTAMGGQVREEQNWIGGSSYNPCSASFVPPPPEHVRRLLEDLCAFCNTDSLPAVTQAALAHAQFETIHPFVDGNGRVGRVLIHLVLRRRGLAVRVLPPISLVLATWSRDYIAGLTATRHVGRPDSKAAIEGLNLWVGLFATACRRAVGDAETFERQVSALQTDWHRRLGRVRAGSAADRLVNALPGAPVVTVNGAAELIGRTFQATNLGIARLENAGILKQVNVGRRNRAFEAPELVKQFTDLERRLASPVGDTRSSETTRRVPRRTTAS
ncbi:MAG TPA: Fic family protein [Acidimicrobiales bacterium]|nr:Fic family protein [Acidimicrobiales bacterium]